MRRPIHVLGAVAGAWIAVACLDVSSPVTGIFSITNLQLPTPSVVEHDSSRDTLGNLDSLRVVAFAPNGDTVKDAVIRYFVVDTTQNLHVDSIRGIVSARALLPTGAATPRVFARVSPANGKGFVQTAVLLLPVVPTPVSVTKDRDTVFTATTASDSFSTSLLSPPLGVTVFGATADTLIPSYIVRYELVRSPPSSKPGDSTVVLAGASGRDTSIAVTDGSGHATGVRLRLRLSAVDQRLAQGDTEIAVVRVHVQFRGKDLPVTPADSFVIPVVLKFQ